MLLKVMDIHRTHSWTHVDRKDHFCLERQVFERQIGQKYDQEGKLVCDQWHSLSCTKPLKSFFFPGFFYKVDIGGSLTQIHGSGYKSLQIYPSFLA